MAVEKSKSPAVRLLDLTWYSACKAVPHAWERYNHALHYALRLAVGSGFTFYEEDYAYILGSYRTGYWIGESDEWVYSLAIIAGNMSAIKSFEAARGRVPFIADDVDPGSNNGGFLHVLGRRDRERLAVGFEFPWKGHKVTVTSFSEDGTYLTACAYRMDGEREECVTCRRATTWPRAKAARRFRVTREEIRAERAIRKLRTDLVERLRAAEEPVRKAVFAELAVTTSRELDAVPLETLGEVVERLTPPLPKKRRRKTEEDDEEA